MSFVATAVVGGGALLAGATPAIALGAAGLAGGLSSGRQAQEAAGDAAAAQAASGERALDFVREDLAPFREAGLTNLPIAQGAVDAAQNISLQTPDQIVNNPLFQALSQDQEQRLIQSRAALGLGGSGGTREMLNRNALLLGSQFQQQDLQNQINVNAARFNPAFQLSQIGSNAAAQTGTQSAGIAQGIGNVNAAGIIGEQNAETETLQGLLNLGGQFIGSRTPAPVQAPILGGGGFMTAPRPAAQPLLFGA